MDKIQNHQEKLDLTVLPESALRYITNYKLLRDVWHVMSFGAVKYGPANWKETPLEKFTGAALRHYLAMRGHEGPDEDTGLPHAVHLACNCIIIIEKLNDHGSLLDLSKAPLGYLVGVTSHQHYQVAGQVLANAWVEQLLRINHVYTGEYDADSEL